jgi:ribosome-associated protein
MNPEDLIRELRFSVSKSTGAGGQHLNKVQTKVELRFDIAGSKKLSEEEKELLILRFKRKISQEGILIITNQESRSQHSNKEAVINTFIEMVEKAMRPSKIRKKVQPLQADKEERLEKKRQVSLKKAARKKPDIASIDNIESI